MKLATTQLPPQRVGEEQMLETLAGVTHHASRTMSTGLTRLRIAAAADTTLVVVTAPPQPTELTSLIKKGKTIFIASSGWPDNNLNFGTVFPDMQGLFTGQKTVALMLQDMDTAWNKGPQSLSAP